MNIFNRRPKTVTLEGQKSVLQGRRSPVTGQAVLMTETDAESYRKFLAEFASTVRLHALSNDEKLYLYPIFVSAVPGGRVRSGPG